MKRPALLSPVAPPAGGGVHARDGRLTTSALARATGVESSTIRFYERRHLLVPEKRRPSGYRLYGPDAVRRVQFIRHANALGLSLEEISELLELGAGCAGGGGEVQLRVERKLNSIAERIEKLVAIKTALGAMLDVPPERAIACLLDVLGPGDEAR